MTEAPTRLPYPGLRAFNRDEADLFFGRDGAVNEMIDKLAGTRFLAVLGASGTGKSSLVRTGLLDGLELGLHPAGANWRFCDFTPGGQPIANLARSLIALQEEETAEHGEDDTDDAVAALEFFLRRGPRSLLEWMGEGHLPEDAHLLVLVDQFEELFRFGGYSDREEAEAFVKFLITASEAAEGRVHVVLTMRSEFLGACALIPGLAEAINAGSYLTPRMTRDECKEAILYPARMVGADISPELVNDILNDLVSFAPWGSDPSADQLRAISRRADQLPVMQHMLNRLWQQAVATDEDGDGKVHLSVDTYRALGGLGGALDAHGEEILATMTEAQLQIAERMFRALVTGSSTATATRRPLRFDELTAEVGVPEAALRPVLDAFRADACNFLRPGPPAAIEAGTIVDISHESLIRQWSKLSEWLNAEARAASFLMRLANAEGRWETGEGDLLTGLDLANVSSWWHKDEPQGHWAARYVENFDVLAEFLEKSEEGEAARDRAEKERERRGRRRLAGLAGVSLVFAAVSGLFFFQAEAEAERAELEAERASASEQDAIRQRAEADAAAEAARAAQRAALLAQREAELNAEIAASNLSMAENATEELAIGLIE
ncbi:MAG: hypothetical protein AAFW69_03460, partial [Pseudomonadota bacterium]